VPKRLPESPDLALAPFAEGHFDAGLSRPRRQHPHVHRRELFALDDHPPTQPVERLRLRLPGDDDDILLLDMVARVHQPGCELAVIGQQDESPTVEIEPPNRKHATRPGRKSVHDAHAPARIPHAGQDAAGLVQQQVGPPREGQDGLPANHDLVDTGLDILSGGRRQSVDRHLAGGDQLIGLASRGHAGAC